MKFADKKRKMCLQQNETDSHAEVCQSFSCRQGAIAVEQKCCARCSNFPESKLITAPALVYEKKNSFKGIKISVTLNTSSFSFLFLVLSLKA